MRSLVVTFGLAIVIQNVCNRSIPPTPSIDSGGLTPRLSSSPRASRSGTPLLIFAAALALTAGLQLLFDRTDLGRAFRAVSDDREAAELMASIMPRVRPGDRHRLSRGGVRGHAPRHEDDRLGYRRTIAAPLRVRSMIIAHGSFYGTLVGGMLLGVTQDIASASIRDGDLDVTSYSSPLCCFAERLFRGRDDGCIHRLTDDAREPIGGAAAAVLVLWLSTFPWWADPGWSASSRDVLAT